MERLRQSLTGIVPPGSVDWNVRGVDSFFCPALDIVHPIVHGFGAGAAQLGLDLVGSNTRLRDGEHILPRLVMPNFRGQLRVDYVAHDGVVLHLYPQIADPNQRMTADPPRVFAAGETVKLGDPSPGHPAWEVAPPYGSDMIIAIASTQPLFSRPRPSNVETATDYLRELQTAVDEARSRGVKLAGGALVVDTLPK